MAIFANRKGIDYAALLMVVVALSVVALHSQVSGKLASLDKNVGDAQAPLLNVNAEVRFYEAFVKQAAELSLAQALKDMEYSPAKTCWEMNGLTAPEQAYSFAPILQEKFNARMDEYLKQYSERKSKENKWIVPSNNFVLSVSADKTIGVSVKPTILPITDFAGRKLGDASFRPAFEFKQQYKLDELSKFLEALSVVAAKCSLSSDPLVCAQESGLKVEAGNDKFNLVNEQLKLCFSLFLSTKKSE